VLGGMALQVAVGIWPLMAGALGCVPLGLELWAGILAAGLGVWGVSELINKVLWR
jgi:hypothetical protein